MPLPFIIGGLIAAGNAIAAAGAVGVATTVAGTAAAVGVTSALCNSSVLPKEPDPTFPNPRMVQKMHEKMISNKDEEEK